MNSLNMCRLPIFAVWCQLYQSEKLPSLYIRYKGVLADQKTEIHVGFAKGLCNELHTTKDISCMVPL